MFRSKLYKEIFYQSRLPQMITSSDLKQIEVNDAFLEYIGYTREEWSFLSIDDISHPDDLQTDFILFTEVINGRRTEYELEKRYIHKTGKILTGIINVSLIDVKDDEIYYLGQIQDITEKKHIENVLIQSEQKYRLLAENLTDVISLHNVDSTYLYVSPSMKATMGYDSNELIGTSPYMLIHPEDITHVRNELDGIIEGKESIISIYRARKSNGQYIWVETIIKAVRDERIGELLQLISVTRDINQRIHTNELLRRSDKLAVLGQMAAAVAHEIRNPLTPIKGFLKIFIETKELKQEFVTIMLDELTRIENIITEFLNLAKPHYEKVELVNVNEIIKQTISLIQAEAALYNKEIIYEENSVLPEVLADCNSLKQVFLNIIQNGIEATPEQGNVKIECGSNEEELYIYITDNGCGISKERLEKIGEPFYSTKEKGTGLGLMTSFKIIEDHDGRVEINSQVGIGTRVSIYLPLNRTK